MKNKRDPNARITRWRLKLDEYEYELVFKSGVTNVNADALSRNPVLNLKFVPMTNKKILVLGTIQEEPHQILSIEPTSQADSRHNTRSRRPSQKYLDAINALQPKQRKNKNEQPIQEEVARTI